MRPPKIVSITATSRCNLRCVMCDHGVRRVEKQDFDPSLIDKIGEFYAQADVVDLTGLGEPMLSDFFWKTLDRCPAQEGVEPVLMFNTNGTLLTTANIDRILRANVRRMRVSIDAADPSLYFDIRGTELAPIVEGTRELVRRRNASGRRSPLIGLEMTVMRLNLGQVMPMIDLAKEIGADFFEAWSVNEIPAHSSGPWQVPYHGGQAPFRYAEQMLGTLPAGMVEENTRVWAEHATRIAMPSGFVMMGKGTPAANYPGEHWGGNGPEAWQEDSIRCELPWTELRTDYDGKVTACCWGPRPIGDLRFQTMQEIWEGPTVREMRTDLVAGRVPAACKGAACQFLSNRG